jgi:hypothetical protein
MAKPKFLEVNEKDQWWDGTTWRNEGEVGSEELTRTNLRKASILENNSLYNTHPDGVIKCPRCYKMHFVPDNYDNLCDGCCTILLSHPKATEKMITGIKYWRSIAGKLDNPEVKARYDERDRLVAAQNE